MFQVCKENKKALIKAAENKGRKNIKMKMVILFGRSEEGFYFLLCTLKFTHFFQ